MSLSFTFLDCLIVLIIVVSAIYAGWRGFLWETLTIFAWDNIPVTVYHQGSTAASGSNLGLLRIRTDSGLEGYAFLGSASNPASMDLTEKATHGWTSTRMRTESSIVI